MSMMVWLFVSLPPDRFVSARVLQMEYHQDVCIITEQPIPSMEARKM